MRVFGKLGVYNKHDPAFSLKYKIMTRIAYADEYLENPRPIREYLKYLKKKDRPYSDTDAKIAIKLAPIIKDIDALNNKIKINPKGMLIPGAKKGLTLKTARNRQLKALKKLCQGDSWERFLNSRKKQEKKKEMEDIKKENEKLKSDKEKMENRGWNLPENISDDDMDAVDSLQRSLDDFLKQNEDADLPLTNKVDLAYLLSVVFHDLNPDINGLLCIDIGPKEKESAHNWLKKVDKLFAQASKI